MLLNSQLSTLQESNIYYESGFNVSKRLSMVKVLLFTSEREHNSPGKEKNGQIKVLVTEISFRKFGMQRNLSTKQSWTRSLCFG